MYNTCATGSTGVQPAHLGHIYQFCLQNMCATSGKQVCNWWKTISVAQNDVQHLRHIYLQCLWNRCAAHRIELCSWWKTGVQLVCNTLYHIYLLAPRTHLPGVFSFVLKTSVHWVCNTCSRFICVYLRANNNEQVKNKVWNPKMQLLWTVPRSKAYK